MERFRASPALVINAAVAVAFVATLLGCSSRIDQRGNLPDPDVLANVEVGHINKQGVRDLLGSPSSVGLFGEETWYYISERTEKIAFLTPTVLDRKVVVIKFDAQGVVSDMTTLGLEDSRNVEIVGRKTPSAGQELGFLRQLFGNIGRFEAKGKSSSE